MVFNIARLFRFPRHAEPEIDPLPLPVTIITYTEDLIAEPATDQSHVIQDDLPIHFHALGIGATNAQVEFDQDIAYVDEDVIVDFTGE
ncbi:hypothetical protein BG015_009608 [Linnemannia schmuckeri]|uniref:Uncharacterized protein n=1 Tax=Linnemannia schmuckeri TaxID=64567 RepID=A0A9P5RYT6_9FUNG|nr:hypothetical protein BG015_009608 [Linnemannia schmuckeri]